MKLFNVDSTVNEGERLLSADQAAKLLGVRKATLYAYVSRGLLRSYGNVRSRGSRYLASDVARVRARSEARAGHTAVAAGALRWGEPVLDSAITDIGAKGPLYRGHAAVDLAARGVPFESVAELLWTGALPPETPAWPPLPLEAPSLASHDPLDGPLVLARAIADAALVDPARHDAAAAAELERARRILAWLPGPAPRDRTPSFAARLALSLGLSPSPRVVSALDTMLVLVADHELNASSFAARVAASTGADLYACIVSALAAASGPLHGGAGARIEALLDEVGDASRARSVVDARTKRGDAIAGFGHPLYPGGDPRATPLLALATRLAPRSRSVRTLDAIARVMKRTRHEAPTVDFGLVAAAEALGAPRGTASLVFVLGRSAGWVAHVLEQRAAGFLLRPRARYIGPAPV